MDNNMIQIMIGIGQIIAVAVIPIIVWVLGIKYQDRIFPTFVDLRYPVLWIRRKITAFSSNPTEIVQ